MEITNEQSNTQIIKSVASNFIGSLSSGILSYGIGIMLLKETSSSLSFGLEMIITPIISIIFLIPIGNIIDSYKHKKILIISSILKVINLVILLTFFSIYQGRHKLLYIIIFIVINSICMNTTSSTYQSSVHELVNKSKIPALSSYTNAATSLSNVVSPVLGISLYTMFGLKLFILFEIISSISSFIIIISMKFFYSTSLSKDKASPSLKNQVSDFMNGINYIVNHKLIFLIIITGITINFLFTSLNIGIPYMIQVELHLNTVLIGWINTIAGAGLLLGSLISQRFHYNKNIVVKLTFPLIIISICMVFLGLLFNIVHTDKYILILGGLTTFIIGMSLAIIEVVNQINIQKTVPTNLLGRTSSIIITSNTSVIPLGTLLYSYLFEIVRNGANIFIISGIVGIFFGIVSIPLCMFYLIKEKSNR